MTTCYYKLIGIIRTLNKEKNEVHAFITSLSGKNTKTEIPEPLSHDLVKMVRYIEGVNHVMKGDIEVAKNIIALYQEEENKRPPH